MKAAWFLHVVVIFLLAGGALSGQSSRPIVTMSVTLPSGETQELNASESGLAKISLEDGTNLGFRPTIRDSAPWTDIVVTVFKMDPVEELGKVEVTTGASPADSKTTPAFTIAVTKVSAGS